ncbi:transcriptional repressor [bacterium CG17_big_fil_post_rev_8_21_14_2_50_64_8]|nr:MAG: transcriptional repressor [bacterium CG17_big_fil_post_rev_8_21_14_2_50_64_8]PJA73410.1 MAG: transcriptional repressor [bacterium CG_4_9_14_3_um_filter_65_15]
MKSLDVRQTLHAANLRATTARMVVLELVRSARKPLSHGEIAELLRDGPWNRATLYRNLIDLERAGLVRRTQLGEPVWRFEDAAKEHGVRSHPHFLCSSCGKMVCLPQLDTGPEGADGCRRAVRQGNFEVQVRGRCDACSSGEGMA